MKLCSVKNCIRQVRSPGADMCGAHIKRLETHRDILAHVPINAHIKGRSRIIEYKIWLGMKSRCHNKNNPAYPKYGGRGIFVCASWKNDFDAFLKDMGPRPGADHSIERVDNNAGYSRDNCIWAERKAQCRNRTSSRVLTHNGESMVMAAWAERLGVNMKFIHLRLYRGWSVERALTEPAHYRGQK